MSGINRFIKPIISKHLPAGLLHQVKKRYYLRILKRLAAAEVPDLAPVQGLLRRGEAAVDVGANFGVFTRFLADFVGPSGEVHSVEPVPQTFDLLRFNVKKLELSWVKLYNCATSDLNGPASMEIPDYDTGGKNYYQARLVKSPAALSPSKAASGLITIENRTLDSLFSRSPRPIAFIKVDVESFELECIKGSNQVLSDFKPAWLIEVWGDPDAPSSRASELFGRMSASGYQPHRFDGKKLLLRRAGDRSTNYFFLQEKHLQRVSHE